MIVWHHNHVDLRGNRRGVKPLFFMEDKMKNLLLVFVFILVIGCAKKDARYFSDSEIDKINNAPDITDIFKEKFVVTLELTSDKRSIVNFRGLEFNGHYIYTSGYLWNAKGNFIAPVGGIGKGPGEYMSAESAFFYDNDKMGVFDSPRNLIVLYRIDEKLKKVEFIDTILLDRIKTLPSHSPDRIDYFDDSFVLTYLTGLKNEYQVIILDKNFNVVAKVHKATKNFSYNRNYDLCFAPGRIYIPSVSSKKHVFDDTYIYCYNLKGELLYKMNTYSEDYIFERDLSGRVLFVLNTSRKRSKNNGLHIIAANGIFQSMAKKVKKDNNIWIQTLARENIINRLEVGQYHEFIVTVEAPKNKKTGAVLHFYQYDLGLEPLHE